MKVRLFDEAVPVPEKELILRLMRIDGDIVVAIVNETGHMVSCGRLVSFSPKMELTRNECVNRSYGIPLNEEGAVALEGEDD